MVKYTGGTRFRVTWLRRRVVLQIQVYYSLPDYDVWRDATPEEAFVYSMLDLFKTSNTAEEIEHLNKILSPENASALKNMKA